MPKGDISVCQTLLLVFFMLVLCFNAINHPFKFISLVNNFLLKIYFFLPLLRSVFRLLMIRRDFETGG